LTRFSLEILREQEKKENLYILEQEGPQGTSAPQIADRVQPERQL
jgi:hypothetical protein